MTPRYMRVATLGVLLLAVLPAARGSAVNAGVQDGDPDDKYGVDTTTAETGGCSRVSNAAEPTQGLYNFHLRFGTL